MDNETYKREYRETLNAERRFVKFFFQEQITVLIVTFILTHDTRWYDTSGYQKFGIFTLLGTLFILYFYRIIYLDRKWPKWFHSVEKQNYKENPIKPRIPITVVNVILYIIGCFAIVLLITIPPVMYFPDRYQFLPIIVSISLVIILWIYSLHRGVVKGEAISLFMGYIPDLALVFIFGIILPFFVYEFMKPISMKNRPIISIYSLTTMVFVWFFAVYWKAVSGRAYKVIAEHLKKQGVEV